MSHEKKRLLLRLFRRGKMNEVQFKIAMIRKGEKLETLAPKVNMCGLTLRRKLKGESDFTIGESLKIKEALQLSDNDYFAIFFNGKLDLKSN